MAKTNTFRLFIVVVAVVVMSGAWAVWHYMDSVGPDRQVARFLEQHWQNPLPPQGAPPAQFSALEASLDPKSCGTCHAQQYRDWQTSLHSHTIGPGLLWQFDLMNQAEANKCLRCHAPLAEQKALLAQARHWAAAPSTKPPDYVPTDLAHQGLVCAACHVREHRRFGPPPLPGKPIPAQTPHGGFTASKAFEDSRFCAACHQFPADGPRINGKLHEDTYEQWRNSRFAREGVSCQGCHMPARRHLWRGIHSPEMVRQAIDVKLDVSTSSGRDGRYHAVISNVGAGHDFPTYMVAKVYVELDLVSPDGKQSRSLARRTIGWDVDSDLTHEISDTRLPPGGRLDLADTFELPNEPGWRLLLRISVAPGEHYERTFTSMLNHKQQLSAATLQTLSAALAQVRAARFVALELARPCPARIAN
ncbi:MAG: hypothetical protein GC149_14255 [Gammaproteobacteria bacterium]|nr:hypothetical protein [Gammaproteobacteria bacterium]